MEKGVPIRDRRIPCSDALCAIWICLLRHRGVNKDLSSSKKRGTVEFCEQFLEIRS